MSVWLKNREGTTFLGNETVSEERKSSSFIRPQLEGIPEHVSPLFSSSGFFLEICFFNTHKPFVSACIILKRKMQGFLYFSN